MKKMLLLTSMFCSMLLMAMFAAAEVSRDYKFPETRYIPSPFQKQQQQRLLMDDYRQWFYFDRLNLPTVQRIIDVDSLDVDSNDLATPAMAGAQRLMDERFAWKYGYDLETSYPMLSPYGERRVLKAEGYTGSPIALESAAPIQMNMREAYRTKRARTMARWLAMQHRKLPVIRRYSQYPMLSVQSLDNLDIRPIYNDEYERYQGLRDVHSNTILRQHFLRDLPGISFNELREMAGAGQLKAYTLSRLQFMTREGIEDDNTYNELSRHFGEDLEENSNILLRDVFRRTVPSGMSVYDRFPETRQGPAQAKVMGATEPLDDDTLDQVPIGSY